MCIRDRIQALEFATGHIRSLVKLQHELVAGRGKTKRPVIEKVDVAEIENELRSLYTERLKTAIRIPSKEQRQEEIDNITAEAVKNLSEKYGDKAVYIGKILHEIERDRLRAAILDEGVRADGRGVDDIRKITIEVGVLPRTHGSCLFTRGETQALVVATLGTKSDEQRIDALIGEHYKRFMLHYNF